MRLSIPFVVFFLTIAVLSTACGPGPVPVVTISDALAEPPPRPDHPPAPPLPGDHSHAGLQVDV